MNANEKTAKIISLFNKGKEMEKVAEEVGYANAKSLSRFMLRQGYRWDRRINNYYTYESKKKPVELKEESGNEEIISSESLKSSYTLDNPNVVKLLDQSEDLLTLLEKPTTEYRDSRYNFWKTAQKFSYTKKASIATSLRLPNDLNEELTTFRKNTNLTQTQVICMALDYFINNFKNEATIK